MRGTGSARLAALIWLSGMLFEPALPAQDSTAPPATNTAERTATGSSSDEIQQLKRRLDRLEKQNEQLQKALQKTPAPSAAPVLDPDAVSTPSAAPAAVPLPLLVASEPDLPPKAPVLAPEFSPESPSQSLPNAPLTGEQSIDPGWQMDWRNGLQFATRNGDFTLHVGGRLFFDGGWNAADQSVQSTLNNRLEDGALVRSARIRVDGTMYQNVSWIVEYDIANTVINDDGPEANRALFFGSAKIAQAAASINAIPILGDVGIGYLLEPLCFSTEILFMEQAPRLQSLIVRAPGITVSNTNAAQTLTWSTGVFHDTENQFGFGFSGIGRYDEAARLTWLPWAANDGSRLLHLGFGGGASRSYQR